MKRFLIFLLAAAAALPAADPSLFADIGKIEQGLSSITGLRFLHDVPYDTMNKNQLRRYLEQRIHETIKPAELRAEEITLKMLGLIPRNFDLRQSMVDVLTEQAAAFYDYDKKKLFVLEGASQGADEKMALVHELAHALADQHFHLGKFIHEGARSDDESTARLAVMEGQASWLMTAYLAKQAGGDAEVPQSVLESMSRAVVVSADQYPVFANAPPYIRDTLVFPYTDGMLFQNAVYRKQGQQAFSEVFVHPPASTQQILHPDRYLAHSAVQFPAAPRPPDARKFRKLAEGSLGELDYRVLLSQYAGKDEGPAAAAHLLGSTYVLYEHKKEGYAVLAFASNWDSADSARKYFELYRQVLKGKWNEFQVESDTQALLEGRGDSGAFSVSLDGVTVRHLEGLRTPLH